MYSDASRWSSRALLGADHFGKRRSAIVVQPGGWFPAWDRPAQLIGG